MASTNEFENPGGDLVANSVVIGDIAGFLATSGQALSSDFLELASYLYSEGYKDAAAVVCGSALEGHLRKLAAKLEIAVTANGFPKQAEALNSELALKGAYSKLDQENITAWLDLRNCAVSGEYDRYARGHVAGLLTDTRGFLSRYPV